MHKIRSAAALVARVGAGAVLLAGCASGGAGGGSPELTSVTVSTPLTVLPFAPLYVALEEGYFEDEGLDVETVDGGGATQVNASLKSGESQFAVGASSDLINVLEKGEDQIAVSAINQTLTMQTVVSNDYMEEHNLTDDMTVEEKLSALQGANMGAVTLGGAHEIFLRYNMVLAGKNRDSINVIRVGPGAAALSAMKSGDIDGFMSGPPVGAQAEAEGSGTVLFDPAQVGGYDDLPWEVLITTPSYAESNPDVVRGMTAALARGMELCHTDPAATAEIVAEYFPAVSEDMLSSSLSSISASFEGNGSMTAEGWSNAVKPVDASGLVSDVDVSEGHLWTNDYVPES